MKSSAQFIDICTLWVAKSTKINFYTQQAVTCVTYIYILWLECTAFTYTRSERQRINLTIVSANLLALTWLHFPFDVRLLACHTVHSNFPILWLRESKFRTKKKNYYKWLLLITTQDTKRIKFSFRMNHLWLWIAVIIVALYIMYITYLWLFSLMALWHTSRSTLLLHVFDLKA